jgi:two-component system, OmpR family, response regulator
MSEATVLVVDDDPRMRELLVYVLGRAGFAVREAADGRAALQAVAAEPPDLVLLDVLMPELDGISVCRTLRARSDLPVVFLSSRGEDIDRMLGLDLGGDDYVAKPFHPGELVSRIRSVLRRTRPARVTESGGVRLDAAAHKVLVNGVDLELTHTELCILRVLLARPGVVVRRAELVREAYGGPHHVSGRTLDSHVRGIRTKLRAHDADHIVTVTGLGWRWDP